MNVIKKYSRKYSELAFKWEFHATNIANSKVGNDLEIVSFNHRSRSSKLFENKIWGTHTRRIRSNRSFVVIVLYIMMSMKHQNSPDNKEIAIQVSFGWIPDHHFSHLGHRIKQNHYFVDYEMFFPAIWIFIVAYQNWSTDWKIIFLTFLQLKLEFTPVKISSKLQSTSLFIKINQKVEIFLTL